MAQRLKFFFGTEEQWRKAHEKWGSVYLILDTDNNRVKIGHSRDPWKRLKTLQTGSSAKLSLVGVMAGTADVEKRLHSDMREHNVHREWFSDGGRAVTWLNKQTNNFPMCRVVIMFEQARQIDVFWEWNPEHKIHFKHVFDPAQNKWVGPLMYSGRPNARPGWSANAKELAAL